MISLMLLLVLAAGVCALWPKLDLRIAVILLVVIELIKLLPR